MKEVYQVVILLDLDLVSNFEKDEESFNFKVKCLRRTILNVLTVFSIQHTNLLSQNNRPHFRWGCKLYCSSQKKVISQKFVFSDFNLEVFEKFEKDLVEQCKQRQHDLRAQHRSRSCLSVGNSAISKDSHTDILENELKNVLCDYGWNELLLGSPIHVTSRNNIYQRSRLDNVDEVLGPSKKPNFDDETTKNFVVIISSVPKTKVELFAFFGRDVDALDPGVFVKSIFTDPVIHQFHSVAKINLLWLDLNLTEQHDSDKDSSTFVDYSAIIDKALKTIGGGLIPLNTALMFLLSDCDKWSNCCCAKKSFPKEMECCLPLTSAMSGFLTKKPKVNDSETSEDPVQHCTVLQIDDTDEEKIYDLCLLPLFGNSKRTDDKSSILLNLKEKNRYSIPYNLYPEGTISIHDVINELKLRPFLFVCTAVKRPERDSRVAFHNLLLELVVHQQALLLSCDHLSQGLLFPANSKAKAAMLYMLSPDETFSNISSKFEKSCMSPSAEAKNYISQFLSEWEPPLPLVCDKKNDFVGNEEKSVEINSIPEKWLNISDSETEEHQNEVQKSCDEEKLNEKLRKSYDSECGKNSDELSTPEKIKEDINELKPDCDDQNKTKNIFPINVEDLVSKLKNIYELAIANGDLRRYAQDMISVVVEYYKVANPKECPFVLSEKLICEYFFFSPSTISKKYSCVTLELKSARVNEHFFQALLRLELLTVVSPSLTIDIKEIVAHLRMVSFVSGVQELTHFIRESVVQNYLEKLKEVVRLICSDLNQPVSLDHQTDSSQSNSSETEIFSSPDKLGYPSSNVDASDPPSVASTCTQLSLKRETKFERYPSFTSSNSNRQIFIPLNRICKTKAAKDRATVSNSNSQKATNLKNDKRSISVESKSTKKGKSTPTTPRGRHVLKTKTVSDTPLSKQVENSVLKRQTLKRKCSGDKDENDKLLIIDETPDKNIDLVDNSRKRRSPRSHAGTIARDVSSVKERKPFTVSDLDGSKQFPDDVSCGMTSTLKNNKLSDKSARNSRAKTTSSRANIVPITPERKAKVCRHLNLSGLFSPPEKKCQSENVRTLRSNSRKNLMGTLEPASHSENSCAGTALFETPNKGSQDSDFICDNLLSTPKEASANSVSKDSNDSDSTVIASTPTRNGVESPVTLLEDLGFMYSSLTNGLTESLSRSSSPRIPLLFEGGEAINADFNIDSNDNLETTAANPCSNYLKWAKSQKADVARSINSDSPATVNHDLDDVEQNNSESLNFDSFKENRGGKSVDSCNSVHNSSQDNISNPRLTRSAKQSLEKLNDSTEKNEMKVGNSKPLKVLKCRRKSELQNLLNEKRKLCNKLNFRNKIVASRKSGEKLTGKKTNEKLKDQIAKKVKESDETARFTRSSQSMLPSSIELPNNVNLTNKQNASPTVITEKSKNKSDSNSSPVSDDLAPQRFTRAASKEIGLSLDAFQEISTIPSQVPIKAIELLKKRYGTLPNEAKNNGKHFCCQRLLSRAKLHWKLKKSKVVCTKLAPNYHLLKKTINSKSTQKSRSQALIKNSTKIIRSLRSSTSTNTVIPSKVLKK